jgi:hypothetical protein
MFRLSGTGRHPLSFPWDLLSVPPLTPLHRWELVRQRIFLQALLVMEHSICSMWLNALAGRMQPNGVPRQKPFRWR